MKLYLWNCTGIIRFTSCYDTLTVVDVLLIEWHSSRPENKYMYEYRNMLEILSMEPCARNNKIENSLVLFQKGTNIVFGNPCIQKSVDI